MVRKVYSMYFSGTETTKKTVEFIGKKLSEKLKKDFEIIDFTPLKQREKIWEFSENDLVVFGTPVIAGRVPNVLLKFFETIKGNGSLAVPIVLFGNRNYDDALIELTDILKNDNFIPVSAGAFIGEHSFSEILGKGRPDKDDFNIMENLVSKTVENIETEKYKNNSLKVKGEKPYRYYYQPRDSKGVHIDIRKVKPKTDMEKCNKCGICADLCPMGSISKENPEIINGICIKCCACVKRCPEKAKYFDDKGYIYHKEELELQYAGTRKEPEIFY